MNEIVTDQLRWFFREQSILDYGIDAQIEVVDDDDLVSGRLLGLQIKGGDSQFAKATADGWTFRSDSDHLSYWLGHGLPVIVVIVAGGQAYWQVVSTSTVRETKKGFALLIPRSQPFDARAGDQLRALAGRSSGVLDRLAEFYTVLPGDAVGTLGQAEQQDRLATARLAERLAMGRATPDLTAASLIAAKPTWLTESRAVQDLWMAVAAYSAQHEHLREAATTFELAADCDGPKSARARAFAGIALLFLDRDRARELLLRARDEGQSLLADVGLPALEVPADDARVFDIPQSMLDASEEQLNAEPTVLNFLGEMALRRGDLNAAVAYRERAVRHSATDNSGARLALAETLGRRNIAVGDWSPRNRREALAHAQMAVEDRRRWDGPSAKALTVVLDIHIASGEATAAVVAALPAVEGGTAREIESTMPGVASRGALSALQAGNRIAYAFFMQQLPDGPARHELEAMERDLQRGPTLERISVWASLLEEADDDEMAARGIARLSRLGQWPPQAENLRSRSVLPQEVFDTLHAVYRVFSGERDLGTAALRELSHKTSQAAIELVMAIEETVGGDAAIVECDTQMKRWRDPTLSVLLEDLLRRHGGEERAAQLIEQTVGDDAFSVDVRVNFCRWYVTHKAKSKEFAAAAAMAAAGLALVDDPDLAWNLVAALFNQGKVTEAREAVARRKPVPGSEAEIRLWMHLHLGVPVSVDDARLMMDIVERQPYGDLKNAVAGFLVREVLFTPRLAAPPFPAELTQSVRELAGSLEQRPGQGPQLMKGDDDSLREALKQDDVDPVAFQKLLDDARRGICSLAAVARAVRKPYGTALLQRPAGVLFAADLTPGLRSAGESAAERALAAGLCAVDLSSLHLLNLLNNDDRLRIRANLPRLVVAVTAVDDAIRTRDSMRSLAISAYSASLRPDGTIERRALSATQKVMVREQAEKLETLSASLDARWPSRFLEPGEDTIVLAAEHNLPLWCDDTAMRQHARGRGVATFGLLDLITVLERRAADVDVPAIRCRLIEQYVVDLPATAADLISIASRQDWAVGPVHVALTRAGWWRHESSDWEDDWVAIATSARGHSASALVEITKAALVGAVESVSGGRTTQRYQRLVVLALVACHQASKPSPDCFLDELARHAAPSVPPEAKYVLRSLFAELRSCAVADAEMTAMGLIPGVGLS